MLRAPRWGAAAASAGRPGGRATRDGCCGAAGARVAFPRSGWPAAAKIRRGHRELTLVPHRRSCRPRTVPAGRPEMGASLGRKMRPAPEPPSRRGRAWGGTRGVGCTSVPCEEEPKAGWWRGGAQRCHASSAQHHARGFASGATRGQNPTSGGGHRVLRGARAPRHLAAPKFLNLGPTRHGAAAVEVPCKKPRAMGSGERMGSSFQTLLSWYVS